MKLKMLITSLLLTCGLTAQAATLYVKTTGNDAATCATWTAACKTINQAAAKANSGDTIHIAKGVYRPTATITVSGKDLRFIGGFNEGDDAPTGDKFSTVISGDTDNNDTNKSNGITPSYSDIKGTNLSHAFNVSNASFSFSRLTITGIAGAEADAHGPAIFYASSSQPTNNLILNDVGIIGNKAHSMGLVMAYIGGTNKLAVSVDNVLFENNHGDAGILTFHSGSIVAEVLNSTFRGNRSVKDTFGWNNGFGAIWAQGGKVLTIENSLFENNQASDGGGALVLDSNTTTTIKSTIFDNNRAGIAPSLNKGGAIYVTAGAKINLSIEDSQFKNNSATMGGAINVSGDTIDRGTRDSSITINRSSFTGNQTSNNGGAIYAEKGIWNITNTTVSNNSISGTSAGGGGIANNGALMKLRYVSIVNNHAANNAGGIGVWYDTFGEAEIESSIITGNTVGVANVSNDVWLYIDGSADTTRSKITDLGYNLIGSLGSANFFDMNKGAIDFRTWFKHKVGSEFTSQIITGSPQDFIELTAKDNGGKHGVYTNKLNRNDTQARDAIPHEGGFFYGIGQSAAGPFLSLEQARAALATKDYQAGTYFFDLDGSYDPVTYAFTPGNNNQKKFTTYVDKNGYVLIASSNRLDSSSLGNGYTPVTSLTQRSEGILTSTILADAKFKFDEVRISSLTGGDRGTFDGYNKSPEAIAKVKAYQTLPNASQAGGNQWVVTHSSTGSNYFKGTSAGSSGALNRVIYHSSGSADGIHWMPATGEEALHQPSASVVDDMDLWVRASTGVCNGSVATDGRGLPRSDKTKAEDPIANCDIGAFEFNDYFRQDCWDEDGMRPENTLQQTEITWCLNPLDGLTPRDIMENMGAFHWYWSLMLVALFGIRRKFK